MVTFICRVSFNCMSCDTKAVIEFINSDEGIARFINYCPACGDVLRHKIPVDPEVS